MDLTCKLSDLKITYGCNIHPVSVYPFAAIIQF